MATPNKIKLIAEERGQDPVDMVLSVLNEKETQPAAAGEIGVSQPTVYDFCVGNHIKKRVKVEWYIDTPELAQAATP